MPRDILSERSGAEEHGRSVFLKYAIDHLRQTYDKDKYIQLISCIHHRA